MILLQLGYLFLSQLYRPCVALIVCLFIWLTQCSLYYDRIMCFHGKLFFIVHPAWIRLAHVVIIKGCNLCWWLLVKYRLLISWSWVHSIVVANCIATRVHQFDYMRKVDHLHSVLRYVHRSESAFGRPLSKDPGIPACLNPFLTSYLDWVRCDHIVHVTRYLQIPINSKVIHCGFSKWLLRLP